MVKNPDIEKVRHSLSHLLAAAVLELYPEAKPAIGPAIENGFYYDFEFSRPISENDLPKIEAKMKEILKNWDDFRVKGLSAEEAGEIYKDNPYKLELLDEIEKKGEEITLYASGNFEDLCRGGHADSAKDIDPDGFSLSRLAGAYWRGDEKNKMLTRIYGLAFKNKKELEDYLKQQDEAKERDHRKIGQEQKIFFIDDMVGKGLAMWLPNGTIIKKEIENLAEKMENEAGYIRVSTPHIAREELYLVSGHLPYYKDSMYPPMEMDDGNYYLRGMNCPHHHRIYLHEPKSYRDLPLRMAEYGAVYRNELSGTLTGLLRVRGLTMNDAHIYCIKNQIKEEFEKVMEMTMKYFEIFSLKDYWFRLSKWDKNHTDKYINEPDNWEYSQNVLREVLEKMRVPFTEADDEAAFYGPKVDVQFKSVSGREETMSTIQLDFLAKERFGLRYTDRDGKENGEVFVIHRAPLSTHERFIAFLIEHYAGAFPLWLSPMQVKVLPIGENHRKYAEEIFALLKEKGVRAELDSSDETLGKKIRRSKLEKVPYFLVIGDNEIASGDVTVESREKGSLGQMTPEEFAEKILKEISKKSL